VTAENLRRVGLDGPANFRDLGGYPAGTRRLRRGRVFRSDSLSRMSPSDVRHVVDELGVVTVVDLRAGHEVETYGHGPLGSEGVRVHHLPIADETRPDRVERPADAPDPATLTLDRIYLLMLDRYAERVPTTPTLRSSSTARRARTAPGWSRRSCSRSSVSTTRRSPPTTR
jgi:hypothetical protein